MQIGFRCASEVKQVDRFLDITCYVEKDTVIHANTSTFLRIGIPQIRQSDWVSGCGVMTPSKHFIDKIGILPALHAIVKVNGDVKAMTSILNDTDEPVKIHKNVTFGTFDAALVPNNE